jgi:hypothetical protein
MDGTFLGSSGYDDQTGLRNGPFSNLGRNVVIHTRSQAEAIKAIKSLKSRKSARLDKICGLRRQHAGCRKNSTCIDPNKHVEIWYIHRLHRDL